MMGEDLELIFKEGLRLYNDKNYLSSRECFERAIKGDSTNPEYHLYMGKVLQQMKETNMAVKEWIISVELYDKKIGEHYEDPYYHNGKGEALLDLALFLDVDDDITVLSLNIYFLLGTNIEREMSDYFEKKWELFNNAIEEFNTAIRLDPGNPSFHRNKALLLKLLGELFDRKMNCVDEFYFGDSLSMSRKMYGDALNEYRTLVSMDSEDMDSYENICNILYNLEQYDEAIKLCSDVLKTHQDDPNMHFMLGRVMRKLGKYEKAIEEYDRALQSDPHGPNIHNNKGVALNEMGDLNGAMKEYEKAIAIDPDHSLAHFNRGNILMKLGRYEEAVTEFDISIQIDPSYSSPHLNKGISLRKLGKKEEADREISIALNIDPCIVMKRSDSN
jgi:tetratricopeptide (TPR) repeat protein